MFKNLIETMSSLSGKGRGQSSSMSEIEKVFSVAFMLSYFLISKFINKIVGLNIVLSMSLMAVVFICVAHQLDKKLPFPNKHFWKMVTILLMAPVFLLAGV